ncbi:rod shape-determining protein MreC [Anaerococcus lactolyticus ATCC 51172]|uniref:Cell shape-determining protein MreC n=2 Tax=Anaerococcus lactolyticus TaxID=33032 RepID=C2BCF8_9FIRM|nr:rod shape-determining protein MreC [Anaerococcus lactolyticus ATCC 51172]
MTMAYKRVKKDKKPFILTVVGLSLLILISSQTEGLSKTGSNLANSIFKPIEGVTYSISSAIIEQIERTIGSKETREQVLKLEADNRSLVMENARLLATINREEFLKEEAQATKGSDNKYIKAKLINTDVNSMTTHFNIDKGASDGIEKNDIILQAVGDSKFYTGLVGKVTEVYQTTARVETINSNENDVSFVNANSGDYGVIDIFNKNTIQGYMIDLESKINEKDILLTSGLGGIYPYGIYIGRVSTVTMSEDSLRKNITIKSPVDFSHLYRVLVLKHDSTYTIDDKPVTKEKKQKEGEIYE